MTSFVTKNGSLILKDGKLLVGDPSCCCNIEGGVCCLPDGTCIEDMTQAECEDCSAPKFWCVDVIGRNEDGSCPAGYTPKSETLCESRVEAAGCEECVADCDFTDAGPCGTWKTNATCETDPCSSTSPTCMEDSTGNATLPDFNAPCTIGETLQYWTCDCCTPGAPPCFPVNCYCEDAGGQGMWSCFGGGGAGSFSSLAECAASPCLSDLECNPLP